VLELLEDHRRCQVMLVTIPEETPVNEAIETAFSLEDRVGVGLGPIVVNGLVPEIPGLDVDPVVAAEQAGVALRPGEPEALAASASFRRGRMALQAEQIARLEEQLPLPQLRLPFLFTTDIGRRDLDVMAWALLTEIDTLAGLPL
jgi:hypothetical protein